MRISQTGPQFNTNSKVSFAGNKNLYLAGNRFAWFENIDGFKQRAALGAAALLFQPIIDYCNPMTDEKTRKFSVLKTVVKAIVGTTTGMIIRKAGIKYVEHLLNNPQKLYSKIKDPKFKEKLDEIIKNKETKKKFSDNLGTAVGLIGVAIGDFTFDMPIAKHSIQFAANALGLSNSKDKDKEATK